MARKLQADGDAILLAGDDRRLQVVALVALATTTALGERTIAPRGA